MDKMGISDILLRGNLTMDLAFHPGAVAILYVASCDRNNDKLWQSGPHVACV